MLIYNYVKKGLYCSRVAWNKLNFYRSYFHHHFPEMYPTKLTLHLEPEGSVNLIDMGATYRPEIVGT